MRVSQSLTLTFQLSLELEHYPGQSTKEEEEIRPEDHTQYQAAKRRDTSRDKHLRILSNFANAITMPRKPTSQRRRAAPATRRRPAPTHNRTRGTPRRSSPRLFNLGLPRTGTTWFSAVAGHFGLRALHCNEPSGCLGIKRDRLLAAFDTQPTGGYRSNTIYMM